ncbi:MAG: Eco57I restriction-modification methylase domain-containing protein, partial [Thermoguttaceae bacterium]
TDKRFEQVFNFLERYNFTIAEDSPLDQEIAVDPEMIGKVYESLVNVSEEADERGDAGIFYTPRTEIELMCRLSVIDHLANHLGAERKNLLYQLVFSLEPEEKVAADKEVAAAGLWPRVGELLRDITALDPACGSGSFLVGMLHVLDDLQQRANQQLGVDESAYDRKRRIIGQSIYGVDVMDWACHVAELRLWLSLIVHADYTREQLHRRRDPLLPHFSFKIRCGDSLVQEIGGLDLRQCARGLDEGDKGGFDIVVGNPPYVRQENIADPLLPREKITNANKKQYKAKLARSVYQLFPRFFGYKPSKNTVARKLDAKSDLYVYFYFHGLSLLNPKGAFCFITSNSWLDVGYGKDLQEFLLRQCQVKLIMDNEVRRSFASADVNTAIALLSSPNPTPDRELPHNAKFVFFHLPFEQVLSPRLFVEIETRGSLASTAEYRLSVISQEGLLREGLEDRSADRSSNASPRSNGRKSATSVLLDNGHYAGNKLGGKYLRAPQVYFEIFASHFPMFRLGVQKWWSLGRGRRTGCDEFFYVRPEENERWQIEKRFLRPLVKSPTEFSEFGPTTSNLHDPICVFLCQEPKSQLVGTKALQYIRHGESTGVNRRNLQASGGRWYDLGEQPVADVILPIAFNDRFFVVLNDARFEVHQRFATIILDEDHKYLSHALAALLHSSVFALAAEILGRRGLGQGALDFPPDDWRQVAIPDISQLLRQDLSRLTKLWTAIASSPPLHLADAMQDEGHKQLDRLVLKVLGLDEGLLATLHEELQRLTASRLAKALSI